MDQLKLSTNFFESVSKHDLERFHSECLCWLFNNYKQLASEWIKVIKKIKPKELSEKVEIEIDSIEAFTEVDQIDIVIIYKMKGEANEYNGIIIENKVKASEHLIKVKNEKIDNFDNRLIQNEEIILSQTEFYFSRNKAEKHIDIIVNGASKKRIIQIGVKKEEKDNEKKRKKSQEEIIVLLDKSKCNYIFLVPNKITDINDNCPLYQYNELNVWDSKKFQQLNGEKLENPWITYTYIELANFLKNNKKSSIDSDIYANDYIDFLYSQFKDKVNLNNYSENKYGKLEYLKFLHHAIILKLDEKLKELNKDGKVYSKSSNSGDPLFNIIINDKIELVGFDQKFQLGLQVQGITNKIYISAGSKYDSTEFKDSELEKYRSKVKIILEGIKDSEKFNSELKSIDVTTLEPHPNTTKTFYSYCFKFKDEVNENDFHIVKKIEVLSGLINTIFQNYNNTSFTSISESYSKLSK